MAVSHPVDLIGRVLAGRYRLIAPVGVGASAQVFLADDVQLRRRVAVKVLHAGLAGDPTFLRRFQAEAQAAAALNHPNILAVYDWGQDGARIGAPASPDAVPFLVTEYLDGGSLRSILDHGDRLTLSQVLLVGLEACRGLHYAHTRGFVHRDIKPANLLFGDDRRLRIADFGLARALAEASWTEPEGVVLGTARYVSPEQAGGIPVDQRSDVYSLALVLVECVTGVVPHAADTAIATLRSRIGRSITVDHDLFGPLAPLLESAGQADPALRWSAAQLGQALMRTAEQLPAPVPLTLAPPAVVEIVLDTPSPTAILGRNDPAPVVAANPADAATPAQPDTDRAGPQAAHGPTTSTVAPEPQPMPVPLGGAAAGTTTAAPADHAGAAVDPASTSAAGDSDATADDLPVTRRRPWRRPIWLAGVALVAVAVVVLAVLASSLLGVGPVANRTREAGSYVGLSLAQAEAAITEADAGWVLAVEDDRAADVAVDTVIRQTPEPGTVLRRGETITLVRSIGQPLVVVPPLVGKPFDDPVVQRLFAEAELAIRRLPDGFDESVPVGAIVSVTGAGGEVERGSTVDVVVSKGPQPRAVPAYAGQPADAVKADLERLALVPEPVEESSETVPKGVVIRTEPAAGTQVDRGGSVVVVVSSGLPLLTVPDVTGLTGRQAEDRLVAEGWNVTGIAGPTTGRVLTTDPPAGAQRVKGSAIRIVTQQN